MKYKGTLIAQASGSVAGLTFSHNLGGQYIRQRVIPTNPGSPYQTPIRQYMAQLTSLWYNTLTQDQRDAWDAYAAEVPLVDALGEPINVSGLNHYVRSNVPRLQAELDRVDDGPTTYNLGDFTETYFHNASAAAQTADTGFDSNDDWANETGAALLIYISRAKNASINYHKGPYRYADKVLGDDTTPPTSPQSSTCPFAFAQGQKLFSRAQVTRADGRLSAPFRDFTTAVA